MLYEEHSVLARMWFDLNFLLKTYVLSSFGLSQIFTEMPLSLIKYSSFYIKVSAERTLKKKKAGSPAEDPSCLWR